MGKKHLFNTMVAVLVAAAQPAVAASPGAVVATASDQRSVTLTLYNDDLALVKDVRRVALGRGANQLAWRGAAAQMHPETAQLRNLSNAAGFGVQEQAFDFNLLTPQTLLEQYVGREVGVIRTHPGSGAETRETATVLSTAGGVVLKFADGHVETGTPGRLSFPGVPDALHDTPTLTVSLASPAAGAQDLALSYLTGGLSWRADYVAALNATDDRLDISGWATLTNRSGATYRNAVIRLVAGDLHRVRDAQPLSRAAMAMAAPAAAEMKQEALLEYHLYTLQRPTTLADNQSKQVALMSADRVPARKEFVLEGTREDYSSQQGEIGRKMKVGVFVEFDNRGGELGMPLPQGTVRVYKNDGEGNAQFVGEDRIGHTPKNETVRLKLGEASDVTADRKQIAFQKLSGVGRFDYVYESAYAIVLKNAKPESVSVTVREPIPGDWTMVSESQPHAKVASGMAEWKVKVPAEGQATLSYRVRVRY